MISARTLTMQRLAVAVLFAFVFAMALRAPTSADLWWHLRTGDYIVHERTIPHADSFSHTRDGHPWINSSWGSQIILYGLYEVCGGGTQPGASGNIGPALFAAIMVVLGMALVYRMCEGNVYVRAFVVFLGSLTASVFWSARPQIVSFTLSALVLYLLHLYKRRQVDHLWLIPLVMLLWANLHAGFAMGFILLLGFLGGETLGNLLERDAPDIIGWARLRKLALVTGVCLIAVMVNPYGPRLLLYPFETVSIGPLWTFILEWSSPDFHRVQVWPFVVLLFGLMALFGVSQRRADWTDLVLTLGTACMALAAGRNIALFAVIATPVMTRHLNAWLTLHGWQFDPQRDTHGEIVWLNWLLLGVIVALAMWKTVYTLAPETMRRAQERVLPVEAATFINQTPLPGKMFNSYDWGGYLIFAARNVPVYVDGRTDLYAGAVLEDYFTITFLRKDWQALLNQQGIGFMVMEADSGIAKVLRLLPEQWQERQFDDGRSSVFVRVTGGVSP